VGTGSYRFDHWRTEKCFVLRKNPGYWGKPALFPSVEISHIHEEADRVAALLAGEADLTRGLRWQEHQRINDTSGYHSKVANSLTVMLLALNIGRIPGEADNPLSRREVRRAIHLALDRQELVRRGFGGLARPAWQLVPPEVFGYDRKVTGGEHDPEKTRILLRAAGYPGGFGMDLFVSSSSRLLGEAIRDSLAPVGIRVRVRLLPWDDLYRRFLSDHPPQAATFGWSCNSGDESDFLDTCLHSRTRAEGGGMGELNATGLVLPELDRLIVESRHVMRVQDRLEILGRINRLALEELPYIPLTIDPEIYGYVDGLSWEPRIDTRIYLHELRWQPKR
jgi:peptide/nickel transport system substrate-binding protein